MSLFKSREIRPTNPLGRFGLWEGVFTPCVLTILGVIMFMRTGFVVGHSGMWMALVILGVSKVITTLTSLSLSAISTNTEVKGGGVYFMISRALGPDFGGTIGLTLFVAQAVGVSFYVIGFTEALLDSSLPLFGSAETLKWVQESYLSQIIASVTVAALFYLTFKGADVALKVQNYVLVALLISIVSFLIGGFLNFDPVRLQENSGTSFSGGIEFWAAFAIFFPATTGITAGANMSGDLRNPERAIPWGTLLAVVFTLVIYCIQIVLLSGSIPREQLKMEPFLALKQMSVFSPLIILGVFAATLSSALGSFLGAPRILQAMGKDGLMSGLRYFAKGEGPSQEPQRATYLTFIIALAVIWAGDLNAVAEIISMFFLIAYGTINLSAFVESKGGNPSFRPQFKLFHWSTALAGTIGCTVAMMKINDTYALVALGISTLIYFYLNKKDIETSFGDAKRGYIFKGIRDSLNQLQGTTAHPKNWRPLLVAVLNDIEKDLPVMCAGSWIESGRGLYTLAHIKHTTQTDLSEHLKLRKSSLQKLDELTDAHSIYSFPECLVTNNYKQGLSDFLQTHSVGALKTNSILLHQRKDNAQKEQEEFESALEVISHFDLNLCVYHHKELPFDKKKHLIDIWWSDNDNNSLMLLFAYLMTLSDQWKSSSIRILRELQAGEVEKDVRIRMTELLTKSRITAEIRLLQPTSVPKELLCSLSEETADFVFMGMQATSHSHAKDSLNEAAKYLDRLPSTMTVWSNGEANLFV